MVKSNHIIVGIGTSAGGLQALQQFFSALPPQPNVAFVVVMHLLRNHRSKLDQLLKRFTTMQVHRIEDNMRVVPGNIYVLPENHYLHIRHQRFLLVPREEGNINNAVDIFFTSLAEDSGSNAVGIILSGTGTDGTKGAKVIEAHGGFMMVQDPDSSQFNGMPMSIIKFDSPDVIDTPEKLANFIARYSFTFVQHLRA